MLPMHWLWWRMYVLWNPLQRGVTVMVLPDEQAHRDGACCCKDRGEATAYFVGIITKDSNSLQRPSWSGRWLCFAPTLES